MAGIRERAWPRWLFLSTLSAMAVAGFVVGGSDIGNNTVGTLLRPGRLGPSVEVVTADFPDTRLAPNDTGHDGQQFYAIARAPMHPGDVAPQLDRPRYRYQRILMPMLAWILQPSGGGAGLVIALFSVAALGPLLTGFFGACVAGALGASRRACNLIAFFFPVLPGAFASVILTVSDSLALGLALGAIAADQRDRRAPAIVLAVAAVLAKEPILVVVVGWALWRGRRAIPLVVVPAAIAGAWWLWLRATIDVEGKQIVEFDPVLGLWEATRKWIEYPQHVLGGVIVFGSILVAVIALTRRGLRSPLGPAIALQLALVGSLAWVTMVLEWNGARTTAPLLTLAIIARCCPPQPDPVEIAEVRQPHVAHV